MVEDNPGDIRLTREALRDATVPNNLHVLEDGELAMAFLRQESPYADAMRPQLVILDLTLPRKNGKEILEEIKPHEQLKQIPVLVFTSSGSDEDMSQSYALHANAYVTKPSDFDQFLLAVKAIEDFWLECGKLPSA